MKLRERERGQERLSTCIEIEWETYYNRIVICWESVASLKTIVLN